MQAARDTFVEAPGPRGAHKRTWFIFVLVALTAYTTDQVTKALAVARLQDRPDISVIGDLLQLHLTRNPGAAFGLGTEVTPLLSAVAIVAAVSVLWFSRRLGSAIWSLALGLLLAGITGNLTDRIFRPPGAFHGHVIDFLQLPNWPIFNVADICINVAAGLIVVQAVRGIRLDGTRDRDHGPAETKTDVDADDRSDVGGESQ